MNSLSILRTVTLVVSGNSSLQAAVIPELWEKLDALDRGTEILVALKNGERLEGSFIGSGADALILVTGVGNEVKLAKSDVQEIVKKDGSRGGMLKGLGISICVALLATAGASQQMDMTFSAAFAAAAISGGIGALAGFFIYKGKKPEVLYQARESGAQPWKGQGGPQAPVTTADEGGRA